VRSFEGAVGGVLLEMSLKEVGLAGSFFAFSIKGLVRRYGGWEKRGGGRKVPLMSTMARSAPLATMASVVWEGGLG